MTLTIVSTLQERPRNKSWQCTWHLYGIVGLHQEFWNSCKTKCKSYAERCRANAYKLDTKYWHRNISKMWRVNVITSKSRYIHTHTRFARMRIMFKSKTPFDSLRTHDSEYYVSWKTIKISKFVTLMFRRSDLFGFLNKYNVQLRHIVTNNIQCHACTQYIH